MVEETQRRTGQRPDSVVVDSGYTDSISIDAVDRMGVLLYGPLPTQPLTPREGKRFNPELLKPTVQDSEAMVHFKLRMDSPQGREVYRERAETAELTNAEVKDKRGLSRFLVRGLDKVQSVVLWTATALNLVRLIEAGLLLPPPVPALAPTA
jgi:hypothetical protein